MQETTKCSAVRAARLHTESLESGLATDKSDAVTQHDSIFRFNRRWATWLSVRVQALGYLKGGNNAAMVERRPKSPWGLCYGFRAVQLESAQMHGSGVFNQTFTNQKSPFHSTEPSALVARRVRQVVIWAFQT
jgi:hypothetical protein